VTCPSNRRFRTARGLRAVSLFLGAQAAILASNTIAFENLFCFWPQIEPLELCWTTARLNLPPRKHLWELLRCTCVAGSFRGLCWSRASASIWSFNAVTLLAIVTNEAPPQTQTPDSLMCVVSGIVPRPVANSAEATPQAMLLETPLVSVATTQGTPFAMHDACPHRGMRFSYGLFDGQQWNAATMVGNSDPHRGNASSFRHSLPIKG